MAESQFIWIDTESGTWGGIDGDYPSIVLVNVTRAAEAPGLEGDVYTTLDGMSDAEIVQFGFDNGFHVEIPDSVR